MKIVTSIIGFLWAMPGTKQLLNWMWRAYGIAPTQDSSQLPNTDYAVALGFGMRKGDKPDGPSTSPANIAIAKILERLRQKNPNIKLLGQWEDLQLVANPTFVVKHHRKRYTSGKNLGKRRYLDTLEVLRQVRDYLARLHPRMKARKSPERVQVAIVAHPDHYPRVAAVARELGLDPIAVDVSSVEYDKKSIQPWTRDEKKFRPYELIARAHHSFFGFTKGGCHRRIMRGLEIAVWIMVGIIIKMAFDLLLKIMWG